jgi:hypothetical protein
MFFGKHILFMTWSQTYLSIIRINWTSISQFINWTSIWLLNKMFSFDLNKLKQNYLIYILSFFIGVYCLCYISSINYISFPIDHFCSPPFDFAIEHWSPRDWKRYAIPYWDQIPDSLNSPAKENTQSKCLQFTVVENMTDSVRKIEIKYSTEYIIRCQYGWYFSHREISIISQVC